ncbi:MAG: Tol-Pal system beta propeller repeat protein TolB [Gallionellaceae bacterium]|nr:Tol-Pal system beta propeller repeat protein TolB [Gallionellaceae bacterium]
MRFWMVLLGMFLALPVQAALEIEITGAGEHQTPISVVRFAGEELVAGQAVSSVVSNDLMRTGLFKLVDPLGKAPHEPADVKYAEWPGVEALVIGSVRALDGGKVEVRFRLLDAVRQTELIGLAVTANREQVRAIAHRIADLVYERLTGSAGVFSTRIAYVNREGKQYRLVVADSDGYGEQTLLSLHEPIMSPAWSPDGKQIAYVSFERGHATVYVQTLATQKRTVMADFPGSNSAPAWSPDGKQLAMVLTRDGGSQLFLVRADGSGLRRLTFGEAIDTEPAFSPDGKWLLFTSDRGGSAQIYRISTEGGRAERLTFEGKSNFSPRYSPDGKGFVYSHYNGGVFYIATQDFESRQMQILTTGGWEKKPSFAPNGKLILFATESQGRGILATVSSDGRVKQKMVAQRGDIREPVWGPFSKQ